jgi:signal transduction histidine kinase
MATVSAPLARARWLRLPRRTARLRLTLLYSGLFLLLGTVLIVVIALLFAGSSSVEVSPKPFALVRDAAGLVRQVVPPAGIAEVQHNTDLARLLATSWVVLALTAIGSAVLGWFVAGRVLRPLREIATTARTISAGSLHQRLGLTGPDDEFKQLGDTLDELLARLESSFESQRRFVADASHELRTPMTAERTVLQVALADPDASVESLRATCEELLDAGVEQERLLESLLTLATSERGLDRNDPVNLALIAADVVEARRPELERRELTLRSALWPAATAGDPALVERMLANLLDNAAEHNVGDGYVEVRTATEDDRAVLVVANSGPLIPPDQVDRLLEPFQRLDRTRRAESAGHFGLGLAIVRAIATAHGAALDIAAQPGGGLTVMVRFRATA